MRLPEKLSNAGLWLRAFAAVTALVGVASFALLARGGFNESPTAGRLVPAIEIQSMGPPLRPGPLLDQKFESAPTNPLLMGRPVGWDREQLGSPMVVQGGNLYYMYYQAHSLDQVWHIGLATATSPLGPWTRYGNKPILSPTPREGRDWSNPEAWDSLSVTVGHVARFEGTYYMWYQGNSPGGGTGPEPRTSTWQIGLATAPTPEGPWTKYEGNPVLSYGQLGDPDFAGVFVGSVAQVGETFYLWYVGYTAEAYRDGQLLLATAPSPYGPWTKYEGNPVMGPTAPGTWKGGQIGPAAVEYRDGVFHAWYAASPTTNGSQWDIGYASSSDGIHWMDVASNPVLPRGEPGAWNGGGVSDPHVLIERSTIFVYYTGLRPTRDGVQASLGVSVYRQHVSR